MASIKQMAITQPAAFTLTDDYNIYIESLIVYLKEHPSTTSVAVVSEVGYLYRFDLTSFLLDNGIALEDHRLIMRVNGIVSATDIDETTTSLLIPNQALIDRLKSVYRTRLSV